MNSTISQLAAAKLIQHSAGRLFSVTFTKKDGTRRKMTARISPKDGWKTGVNGEGMKYNPSDYGLIPVREFTSHRSQFRMVNIDTLQRLAIEGVEMAVTPF